MINTLHKELRAIALSILDQGNTINVVELEQKVRVLQKQLTILEHEQHRSKQGVNVEPITVFEESAMIVEEPKVVVETVLEKKIETLKIVHHDELDYSRKYSDRRTLNKLFSFKENCDDILIVKNSEVTDTSYGNVIFFDGTNWITPKYPLLKGTCRARLISDGKVSEQVIRLEDLKSLKGVKVINAMRDLEQKMIPIENVIL